jgi:hypothetical protein
LEKIQNSPKLATVTKDQWQDCLKPRLKFLDLGKAVDWAIREASLMAELESPAVFLDRKLRQYETDHRAEIHQRELRFKQRTKAKEELIQFVLEWQKSNHAEAQVHIQHALADGLVEYGHEFVAEVEQETRKRGNE